MPIYKKAHNKYQVQVRIKGQSRYGTFDKKSLAQLDKQGGIILIWLIHISKRLEFMDRR